MNILIVHAHENPESFSSSLKNTAVKFFDENRHKTTVSDLYLSNFNPILSKSDFKELSGEKYYKVQKEQNNAYKNDLFVDDLKKEMKKLEEADLVIFNFPYWWFSIPAILKGWVDRVFAVGFAYGGGKGYYETGAFRGKKAFCTITSGGEIGMENPNKGKYDLEDMLFHINYGMLAFVGMEVLPPFVVAGPARLTNEERGEKLEEYKNYLNNLDSVKPLYR